MKFHAFALLAAPALMLTACGDDAAPAGDDALTETQMDEVEVIDGTISDDMVDLDRSAATDVPDESVTEDGDEASTDTGDADDGGEDDGEEGASGEE